MSTELIYEGVTIHNRGEMLSLTDMWRAAGSPRNREPFQWGRKEGAAFIDHVAENLNLPVGQVWNSRSGRHGGGTFAHWQIGLAYAKYLSPEFHMWCNEVVRAHMEGRLPGTFATDSVPDQELSNKLRMVEETRLASGKRAARWMMARLGLPVPPSELIDRDDEPAARRAARGPYGDRLPEEEAYYRRTRRRGDPSTLAERDRLWKRQGRRGDGLVKIHGQWVDPDVMGWTWDRGRGVWTCNGRWLDLARGGWSR